MLQNINGLVEPQFLAIISDPTTAYMLLLIAFYGLFFEFAHPGYIVPGVLGGVALILAFYSFQLLPISYVGLSLLVLGLLFMIAEAYFTCFGILAITGALAFIIGSLMFTNIDHTTWQVDWLLIGFMTLLNLGFIFGMVRVAIRARLRPPTTGQEAIVNQMGVAINDFLDEGEVRVVSEIWRARARVQIKKGQKVRVVAIDGLTVVVEPLEM